MQNEELEEKNKTRKEIFYENYGPLEFIFPIPNVFVAERIMNQNYKELDEKNAHISIEKDDVEETYNLIASYHTKEYERKEQIEDKAKTSLFVVTLSLTFVLSSLTFIYSNIWVVPRKIILASLLIGVSFLILAGITAIKSLSVAKYNDIYLDGRVVGDYNNLKVAEMSKEKEINYLYECVKLNEIITNVKENYYFATITQIRNGIIFISGFFILAAINFILVPK